MSHSLFSNIIIAPFEQGQRKKGVGQGAYELNELFQKHKSPNAEFSSVTSVLPAHDITENETWRDDYEKLFDVLKSNKSYVLFGGDHSVGQPSVGASLTKVINPNDLLVIWIDAHADTNTYDSSISKNYHGMPLAGIVGYEKPWFNIGLTLPLSNLLYFGIRDLDDFERKKIEENNVFFTSNVTNLINKVNKMCDENPNLKIHISWDVDSLDPQFLDSTGCVVPNGLSSSDVKHLIKHCYNKMIAFDIVEYNPLIGDNKKSYETLDNVFQYFGDKLF